MSLYDKEAEEFRKECQQGWTFKMEDGSVHHVETGRTKQIKAVKCSCGSDSLGSPRHSDYCDKYEKEIRS